MEEFDHNSERSGYSFTFPWTRHTLGDLDQPTYAFTDKFSNIDTEKIHRAQSKAQEFARQTSLPSACASWLRTGGDVVLRVAPCDAAALASSLHQRLPLHKERTALRTLLRVPDWALWEVAQVTEQCEWGKELKLL